MFGVVIAASYYKWGLGLTDAWITFTLLLVKI